MQAIKQTLWETHEFDMIEASQRVHTSLKTILFKKDLRMSSATNKDFSESEISSIIMNDTNKINEFMDELPDLIEVPFLLLISCYYTFLSIGWYGAIVFIIALAQFILSYIKESTDQDIHM